MNRDGSGSIIIIGCGFGGIALGIALKKAGIHSFTILEKAGDVGGVWRDNSYPGAACDVVSRLYSFSFDQDYNWSTAFAPQPEILAYIKSCIAKHGLARHIRFNVEVSAAHFDEAGARWNVETRSGENLEAAILVSAVGLFSQPKIPNLPGRDTFKGVQFHSARWNHEFSLAGKNVAIIGTGASAIQFLPKVAAQVKQLHVFQRSPQYVLPKTAFPGTSEWDAWLQRYPALRGLARLKVYLAFEKFVLRRLLFPHLRLKAEQGFRNYLEAKVRDPELRRKLTPQYPLGCKRLLVSNEWFDALVRPNVELIDTPIEAIVPEGIKIKDGSIRQVDAIIYGTGFATTEYLSPMRVSGLAGRDLNEAWRDGAEAYLGLTVSGFPNFFMLYGPNTNAASSIIFVLECQARYIVQSIRTLRRRNARYMNLRESVLRRFNDEIASRLSKTVPARQDCLTYFKTEGGRITTQWPGSASEYRWRTQSVRDADYEFVSETSLPVAAE